MKDLIREWIFKKLQGTTLRNYFVSTCSVHSVESHDSEKNLNHSVEKVRERREWKRDPWSGASLPKLALVDGQANSIHAKILDWSNQGCRLVVSNAQLFVESEYSLRFTAHHEISPSEGGTNQPRAIDGSLPCMAQVIWSEVKVVDHARYCFVGLRFLKPNNEFSKGQFPRDGIKARGLARPALSSQPSSIFY